jgi:hypothetical protein
MYAMLFRSGVVSCSLCKAASHSSAALEIASDLADSVVQQYDLNSAVAA